MINIGNILRRSWTILWSFRVLWIFGILLALTTGLGNSGSTGSSSYRATPSTTNNFPRVLPENTPEWARQIVQWFTQNVQPLFTHPEQHIGTFVLIAVFILLILLVLGAIAAVVRYPAETAVIRMVDEYERSGSKLGFRQGWKLGWTRRAFRMWLIDLVLAIPAVVFLLLIGAAGLIVYASVSATFQVTNATGVVAAVGLAFVSVFLLVVIAVFLHLLRNFFVRAAVLEDMGVSAALQRGWAMFKQNWKSASLMWLVMVGIWIGFGIVALLVFFLLIPAYLVLLIPGVIVAAVPALIAYAITSIFAGGPLAWIIAILAALPFFFVTVFAPLLLVSGWYKIYEANIWTLTYREMNAKENLAEVSVPVA